MRRCQYCCDEVWTYAGQDKTFGLNADNVYYAHKDALTTNEQNYIYGGMVVCVLSKVSEIYSLKIFGFKNSCICFYGYNTFCVLHVRKIIMENAIY
jgi:hypothetical protein